jgi:hypothetical protein
MVTPSSPQMQTNLSRDVDTHVEKKRDNSCVKVRLLPLVVVLSLSVYLYERERLLPPLEADGEGERPRDIDLKCIQVYC